MSTCRFTAAKIVLWGIGFVWAALFFPQTALALDPQKAINQYVHDVWQDELPQSSVMAITQTRDGYLWLGTHESFIRFDGIQFKSFAVSEELKNKSIYSICEDRAGRLWIGTAGGGLLCYQDGKATIYTTKDGLLSNMVRAISEGPRGELWIGTESGGLNCFKDGKFTGFTTKDGLLGNSIFSLLVDTAGSLWIGTTSNGVNCLKDGKFTAYTVNQGLSNNTVLGISEDRRGNIWIGTEVGLNRFKDGQFTVYTTKDGLSSNSVWRILEDRDGNLWVGTEGGGLNCFRNGAFTVFSTKDGLSQDYVRSLYEDREGSLWIGTNGGLDRLRDGKFTTYTTQNGLVKDYARTIFEDSQGGLWIGTDGGGLSCLKDGKFVNFTTADGLLSPFVKTVYGDRQGNLWVGTNGGLNCIKDGKFTASFTTKEGLSHNVVHSIYEDRQGTLWVGTDNGGVNRFRDGKFTAYTIREGLTNNSVRALLEDRQGTLWIGTKGGLNCLKNGKITAFAGQESLLNSQIFVFHESEDGALWVGTGHGLIRYAGGTWTSYTTKDGLFNNLAFQILDDGQGNFWMGCNKGIYCIRQSAFAQYDRGEIKTLVCTAFGKADGMKANQCNGSTQPAGWKSRDGRLWFPTLRGVVVVDPRHLKLNDLPPPVMVEHVMADNDSLNPKEAAVIEPGRKNLEFHYTGLSFLAPEKVLFRYQLEGFDKAWVNAGTRRVAYYTNIPPGDYAFKVVACNNDGIWNDVGATYRFRLKPPLWQTWWAYLLYLAAAGGTIFGGVQIRLQALRRRNERLKTMVAERTTELNQAVTEVRLSHQETEKKNEQLSLAKVALESKNQQLDKKIAELAQKNEDLQASQQQADRIFSALAEALPGTVLDGKYRLDEKIGSGGFGAVFRSTHLALGRPVAVKVFRPSPGNDSADAAERFRREGISACRVNHPNAISVLDSGISSEGIAYLVMELLEGRSLTAELRLCGRLSLKRCAEILQPVCDALAEAHASGIVHRDIKPDNIFLHRTKDGEVVKVVDFGIAKLVSDQAEGRQQDLTETGGIIGTPTYMAPERLSGDAYDGRADVYSLGMMLYEMLSGQVPFQLTGKSMIEVILKHLKEDPIPLRRRNPKIPLEVEAIVMRALEKDPTRRPTASELAEWFIQAVAQTVGIAHEEAPMTAPSDVQADVETRKLVIKPTDMRTISHMETAARRLSEDEMATLIVSKTTAEEKPEDA